MTDDYKKGLVTGLAMQPLCVVTAENEPQPSAGGVFSGAIYAQRPEISVFAGRIITED